ncbi:MAG: tetratricopeptide repeat protein [Myxococcota bacterium]
MAQRIPQPPGAYDRARAQAAVDDLDDELRDIKREIIESRGLVIKTNNLTNALSADLKSIGKRQQTFERRTFWNTAAANLIVVVVVVGMTKVAWDARVESVSAESRTAKAEVARLKGELAAMQAEVEARNRGQAAAAAFYELMRSGSDEELIEAFDALEPEQLTRAELAVFRDAATAARSELSTGAYHEGNEHVRAGRWHEAVLSLEEAIRFNPSATHASSARLQLARGYRRLNRQRDAIPMLVKLSEASSDAEVLDDAMFLLAECLIDIQAWNDAKTTLRSFIRRYPKSPYVNDAKMALADLSLK